MQKRLPSTQCIWKRTARDGAVSSNQERFLKLVSWTKMETKTGNDQWRTAAGRQPRYPRTISKTRRKQRSEIPGSRKFEYRLYLQMCSWVARTSASIGGRVGRQRPFQRQSDNVPNTFPNHQRNSGRLVSIDRCRSPPYVWRFGLIWVEVFSQTGCPPDFERDGCIYACIRNSGWNRNCDCWSHR